MPGALIPFAFRLRRRKVQNPVGKSRQTRKTLRLIQVARNRTRAQPAPRICQGFFRAHQREYAKALREPGNGASGYIPAADD
jgi:hypothetical protein